MLDFHCRRCDWAFCVSILLPRAALLMNEEEVSSVQAGDLTSIACCIHMKSDVLEEYNMVLDRTM